VARLLSTIDEHGTTQISVKYNIKGTNTYNIMPPKKRNVTDSVKRTVAAKQSFKCANHNLITSYDCPLWDSSREGTFDEAGYEIDHIKEHCVTGDDSPQNLQALCPSCHRVKTLRFMYRRTTDKRIAREQAHKISEANNFHSREIFRAKEKTDEIRSDETRYDETRYDETVQNERSNKIFPTDEHDELFGQYVYRPRN